MLGIELKSIDLDLVEIQDINITNVAIHKAIQAFEIIKKPLFVDDSGIEIPEWSGFPGPFLAHIVKAGGMPLMLSLMKGAKKRDAIFKATIAYHDGSSIYSFEGSLEGEIANEIRGERGFVIDGIFVPKGQQRTFAQMPQTEKNQMSHRSIAVKKFRDHLEMSK